MRWSTGEDTIERLLAEGRIQRVQGAQADGESWLDRARRGIEAARALTDSAPDSSVVLAYDAARQAARSQREALPHRRQERQERQARAALHHEPREFAIPEGARAALQCRVRRTARSCLVLAGERSLTGRSPEGRAGRGKGGAGRGPS